MKLEAINLSKTFDTKEAVNSVSFAVDKGQFLSILGPSGCGKTTLLRMLIGLIPPSSGMVRVDGVDITNMAPSERNMGFVFQNYALFENMTVLQNVEYALRIKKDTKPTSREVALSLIEKMGLSEFRDRKPYNLSGGQQQRVAIARTLALRPDIILFDEPMSALDVATRLSLRAELKQIQREFDTTMIYITHDQEEAFAMSDKILVMDKAIAVQLDTPSNIIKKPANEYVKDFVVDNLRIKINSLSKYIGLANE